MSEEECIKSEIVSLLLFCVYFREEEIKKLYSVSYIYKIYSLIFCALNFYLILQINFFYNYLGQSL